MTFKSRYQKGSEVDSLYKATTSDRKEGSMPKEMRSYLSKLKMIFAGQPLCDGIIAYDDKKETWFYEDRTVYKECSRLWVAENFAEQRLAMGYAHKVDQFMKNNKYRKTREGTGMSQRDRQFFVDKLQDKLKEKEEVLQKAYELIEKQKKALADSSKLTRENGERIAEFAEIFAEYQKDYDTYKAKANKRDKLQEILK